ncbi:amylo-alpha-1,6-glucosidase [Planktothrix pseudagardhii]|uniref:Glycogen debranching enzyme n=1 Tax=Planktothrix pseudagardhii TaxID=132604 RepID=A0A9W4CNA0_9CYAN|nr:amylo-alpha-1,6-glucosidase [Planktothrix pseudagardhii]CAD5965631.1 Glycogen debranching enzyme [Planktothrix pseudagardhii]
MSINFGRETCCNLPSAEAREWLVTNGIGGYASGTIAGVLTRRYQGLLVAALKPPLGRTLLVAKIDDLVNYQGQVYPLYTNRWAGGSIDGYGHHQIERFQLERTIPTWKFACADALLEKRIWMQPEANITYVRYSLTRASGPITLTLKVFVNYRDYHSDTQAGNWQMQIEPVENGLCVTPFAEAVPFYLLTDRASVTSTPQWHYNFDLVRERERGLKDYEDHLQAATFTATLNPGESLCFVASTEPNPSLNGEAALEVRRTHERKLLGFWQDSCPANIRETPQWIQQLVFAADQFIVNRPIPENPVGKTILAGYPWFGDWGRDTMISLPGLTITTGRLQIARAILYTYAKYVDQGMLPNRFPDEGEIPEYNTVDATLWYFEAIRQYYELTEDLDVIENLFPVLTDIIHSHCRGTRYNIHLDPADGLLYAGEPGTQLTWMDAKIGDWVVTPRIGKPIEINALWYNALRIMGKFARQIGRPYQEYDALADRALARFERFWHPELGYCYDVIDGIYGDDATLRPNQIFAVSLPNSALPPEQQRAVVETCGQFLLTSFGLRSLAPNNFHYRGYYGGNPIQRDSAYHQGTVWAWLLGPFVIAHLRVFQNPNIARTFLDPMINHLSTAGIGSISEIFDGNAPMHPQGCIAQAWSVGEILRAWLAIERFR